MDFQEVMETKFLNSYDNLKKILSHYSCPDTCKAHCCREFNIEFGKLEYKRIAGRGLKFQHILKTKTRIKPEKIIVNGCMFIGYEFKHKPCPLLRRNRCSAQDVKPLTCEIYPFALGKQPHPDLVSLEPCPMGVEVMADYMLFKLLHVEGTKDMSEEEKDDIIKTDLELFRQSVESQKNMRKTGESLDILAPLSVFELLADFLDETDEKDRMYDRETLGIEAIRKLADIV